MAARKTRQVTGKRMKALVCKAFGPPENLVIEEREIPAPGPGEVLVKAHAAGVNFPDILMVQGLYQEKPPLPFIPGGEIAGTIEAVGDNVNRYAIGDRVVAMPMGGAFAERVCVSEKLCMPLPERLDFEQGAAFTVTYATSYHAFRQGACLQSGETVLVMGAAGGVGSSAVEIARSTGAKVIAAVSSEEKAAFVRELGAGHVINYEQESLRDRVREITADKGVDVVYDPVGGDMAQAAYRSLAWQGRYLVIGFANGEIPSFPANIALLKEARIIGIWWGTWAQRHPQDSLQNMAELSALVASGDLDPKVTERYPLEEFARAFSAISGRRALGKVVLTMG
jgi:NADPH2:quinone reductase